VGRPVTLGVIALLSVACLYLFYKVIDRSVSVDHLSTSVKHHKQTVQLLTELAVDLNQECRQPNPEQWFEQHYKAKHLISREDGMLFIDNVGLKFEGGKLRKISLMDSH
jgi:hypothetical protein